MPSGEPFADHHRDAFLSYVRAGKAPRTAAGLVGFSWRTVKRHLEADDEFRADFADAEMHPIAEIEDALFDEAKGGNLGAMRFFLTNRAPHRWADERTRAAGAGHVGSGESGTAPEILVGAVREALTEGSRERTVGVLLAVPLPEPAPAEAIEAESTEKQ